MSITWWCNGYGDEKCCYPFEGDENEWGEEVNVFNALKTTTKLHIQRLILKRPGGAFR